LNRIQNLSYKQGDFYLKAPTLNLPEQGLILLTGLSGSGKSTFLNVLSGLLDCPSMSWEFKNKNLAKLPAPQRAINYCFQDLRLFPLMSVKENILFPLEAKKIPVKKEEFETMIEALNLGACLNLSIEKLSGGEKQRVALGRALISPCDILFLDEPFSYLDDTNKKRAKSLVQTYIDTNKLACFLASHEKEKDFSFQIKFNQGSVEF